MIMMTMMTSAQLTLRALMYETKNIIKTVGGAEAGGGKQFPETDCGRGLRRRPVWGFGVVVVF